MLPDPGIRISASAVAVGWSGYVNKFFEIVFGSGYRLAAIGADRGRRLRSCLGGDGIINLPASPGFMCCLLLIRGSKESAKATPSGHDQDGGPRDVHPDRHFASRRRTLNPSRPSLRRHQRSGGPPSFSPMSASTRSRPRRRCREPEAQPADCIISALVIVPALCAGGVTALGSSRRQSLRARSGPCHHPAEPDRQRLAGPGADDRAVISVFSVTLVVLYGQTRICSRCRATACCRSCSTA